MFTSVRTLNSHLKKHNNKTSKQQQQLKCTLCSRVFNSAGKAKAHLSMHEKAGKGAEVQEEVVMKQPMLETAGGDAFEMALVGRPLIFRLVLGLFSVAAPKPKVPYGELEEYKNRPFRCYTCGAAFNKAVHLRRHVLRHTGDKRYKCDLCLK